MWEYHDAIPLLLVCCCFRVRVSGAVEVADAHPRVSGDVSSLSSCPWSQQGGQEEEGLLHPWPWQVLHPHRALSGSPPSGTIKDSCDQGRGTKVFCASPDQIPPRDVHCHVTKKPERTVGLGLAHRFPSGAFLRDVTAAKISKPMKNSSSQMFF